ncbi:TPR domain protein [Arthroderma uncinatum]|uniref:TPR domain protein n=1 Tax=Arthroderma uncinatum TaxID=74035 RepID=UPI00144AB925|nr:TPR domain protein [Arthroderma uncinatum]KAF3490604.1 TPR domain protein [Arthroderma uncinatum]
MTTYYPPSTTPLRSLYKCMIRNLQFGTRNGGGYLLLRSLSEVGLTSTMAINMEDEVGDFILVRLCHHNERGVAGRLPQESVFILKEPFYRQLTDSRVGISIDHICDAIYFPIYDMKVPAPWRQEVLANEDYAMAWNMKGGFLAGQFQYYQAIDCYTKALETFPSENEVCMIKSNRASAFIATNQFDAALSDAAMALSFPATAQGALYYMAQALYNLQRYRGCLNYCMQIPEEYPGLVTMKSKLADRIMEQESGSYRFTQLYTEAWSCNTPNLEYATYIGKLEPGLPKAGRRRGLFTTAAVKVGDLLLCEKAFAHAFGHTIVRRSNQKYHWIGAKSEPLKQELLTMVIQKLYRNPSLASCITQLYCQMPNESGGIVEVDGRPAVDTFLVAHIIALNAVSVSAQSLPDHLHKQPNPARIGGRGCSYGIWPMASFINHSCLSNSHRTFIGDMIIIRATQDLEPGTEITENFYISNGNVYEQRRKFLRNLGFDCNCVLCHDKQGTANHVMGERKTLKAEALRLCSRFKLAPTDFSAAAKIESSIAQLRDTYPRPALEEPRIEISEVQLDLAGLYLGRGDVPTTISYTLEGLASLGYVIENGSLPRPRGSRALEIKRWGLLQARLIMTWLTLAYAYTCVGCDGNAVVAKCYARITYRALYGEDDTFDTFYQKCESKAAVKVTPSK